MVKVITYGTFDMLHHGHIRLLERARELGDFLIVGVTSDDFDKSRGKINVSQTLMERIENVRSTGLADQIIVEEYVGQKIDDIRRLEVDVFTVGSDWKGHFDYLNEWCKVVYLERTQGISSSELRAKKNKLRLGLIGDSLYLNKFYNECSFVNGIEISGICTNSISIMNDVIKKIAYKTTDINDLLDKVDAVFIVSHPTFHYDQIKLALNKRKHVLCESPSTLTLDQFLYLHNLAIEKGCIFIDAVKTSFSTAYSRLLTLIKTGAIGDIVSVDATCTSLMDFDFDLSEVEEKKWNSICAWGPTALLPVFNILGTNYCSKKIITKILAGTKNFDLFTKIDFIYPNAVASIKVGKGIKSEGELIVSGTKGYIFVPAPWWKTDYFEVRFEDSSKNQRYFYQLEGEGIRYEIVSFIKSVELKRNFIFEDENNSIAKIKVIQDFYDGTDRILL